MARTLIKGGWVVSMDDAIGDIRGGDVLIEDDRIAEVGRDIDAGDAEVIGASNIDRLPRPDQRARAHLADRECAASSPTGRCSSIPS
jgi:Cytosine deaminase and related metal-dependent hydrolases